MGDTVDKSPSTNTPEGLQDRTTIQKLRDSCGSLNTYTKGTDERWVVRARKRLPTPPDGALMMHLKAVEHDDVDQAYEDARGFCDAGYQVKIHRFTAEQLADWKAEKETNK